MCKINCSGGCIECAPEEHIKDLQKQLAAVTSERNHLQWSREDFIKGCESRSDQLAAMKKEKDIHQRSCESLVICNKELKEQLAAAQATNAKLREALETCTEGDYSTGSVIAPYFDADMVRAAPALPNDTTALQGRLKEEREKCATVCKEYGDASSDGVQIVADRLADLIRSMT